MRSSYTPSPAERQSPKLPSLIRLSRARTMPAARKSLNSFSHSANGIVRPLRSSRISISPATANCSLYATERQPFRHCQAWYRTTRRATFRRPVKLIPSEIATIHVGLGWYRMPQRRNRPWFTTSKIYRAISVSPLKTSSAGRSATRKA